MADFLQCYNFVSQDVFIIEAAHEPRVCAASNKLFVSVGRSISVYDVSSSGSVSILSFECKNTPSAVQFCELGNFVVTLEEESFGQSFACALRVYNRWWLGGKGVLRYLGNSDTSSSKVDIIELSREKVPCTVACCQTSGTVGIIVGNEIQLFSLALDVSVPSLEFAAALKIRLDLNDATYLSLCEQFVLVRSDTIVQVFRIDECVGTSTKSVTKTSDEDDDTFIEWNFDSQNAVYGQWKSEAKLVIDPVSFSLPFDISGKPSVKDIILGPLTDVPGCKASISDDEYTATLLISCRLDCKVLCTSLLPYYVMKDERCPLGSPGRLTRSAQEDMLTSSSCRQYLKSMTLLISTTKRAVVYDLMEPQVIGEPLIFPQDMLSVTCEQCFLHALSEFTFETFTLPLPSALFQYSNKANIFLRVGTKTMLAMEHLLNAQNNILVLSCVDENNQRTVYSLLKPTSSEFYADMMQTYRDVDVITMQRGLQVIQVQIGLHGERRCSHFLLDTFRSSCALVAERLLMAGKKKDAKNAAVFYELSGRPLEDVLDRLGEFPKTSAVKFLSLSVKRLCLVEGAVTDGLSHSLIASIIQACLTYDVSLLAKLILLSDSRFKSAACIDALRLLGTLEGKLAMVLVYSSIGKPEEAQEIMHSLQHSSLLMNLHHYRAITSTHMSPLGRALYRMRPRLFTRYALQLICANIVDPLRLVELMQMCHRDLPIHRVPALRELLEATWKPESEEFILLLAEIYTLLLVDQLESSERWSGDLATWLKLLPPFNGREPSKECSGEGGCSCAKCQCYLLRLIGLISSYSSNDLMSSRLLEIVNRLPDRDRFIGVKLILRPEVDVLRTLLEMCPQAVLYYLRRSPQSTCDVELWRESIGLVIKSKLLPSTKQSILISVLIHLCEYLPLDGLLLLVTESIEDKSSIDELAIVREMGHKWKALQLKRKISTLGTELKQIIAQ